MDIKTSKLCEPCQECGNSSSRNSIKGGSWDKCSGCQVFICPGCSCICNNCNKTSSKEIKCGECCPFYIF